MPNSAGYESVKLSDMYSQWNRPELHLMSQQNQQNVENTNRRSIGAVAASPEYTIESVMQEFRMNGRDSPYDPDEEAFINQADLTGMGQANEYLRQKSWPSPEYTPSAPLVQPHAFQPPPIPEVPVMQNVESPSESWYHADERSDALTLEQMRILQSLPRGVLMSLLRALRVIVDEKVEKEEFCAFCRSNNERKSFWRSHSLRRDGRVCCPVLRALVCRRCGASGDYAHTLKYCPLSTADERNLAAAVMNSIRSTSGRRHRVHQTAPSHNNKQNYMLGKTSLSVVQDQIVYYKLAPLDPVWAELEKKLLSVGA